MPAGACAAALRAVCAAALLIAACGAAHAALYPARPIEVVIPYGAGGSTDTVARVFVQKLEQRLGQSVVIINKPGASGTIGASAVARAEPDGYTLLLGFTTELAVMPQLSPNARYSLDDFVPIAVTGVLPEVLLGANKLPAATLQELIDAVRRAPGRYTYGGSLGSPSHLAGAWLSQLLGFKLIHVPYKGGAQGVGDVIGGHLDLFFGGTAVAKPAVDGGLLKAFAVTRAARSPALPAVPTFKEAGVPQFDLFAWTVLLAPKGTPADVVQRLKTEVAATLADDEVRRRMAVAGVEPSSEDAAAFLAHEREKFARLLRETGIRMEP